MTQTDVIRRLLHIYAIRQTTLAAWHLETLRLNLEQTLTEIYKNNTYQYMYLRSNTILCVMKINPGMLLWVNFHSSANSNLIIFVIKILIAQTNI